MRRSRPAISGPGAYMVGRSGGRKNLFDDEDEWPWWLKAIIITMVVTLIVAVALAIGLAFGWWGS